MYFTPEYEGKVIRESVSHKLDRPLVNPLKLFLRDSTKTKAPTPPFHIGDFIRYKNKGHNKMVKMLDANTNDPDRIKYIIKFLLGNTMLVTK